MPDGITVEIDQDTDFEPDAVVNRGARLSPDAIAATNPVIVVEAPVVPISPLTTVKVPWLVIPEVPPKPPNSAMVGPRMMGGGTAAEPVVKNHGSLAPVVPSGLPATSVAPLVIVAM